MIDNFNFHRKWEKTAFDKLICLWSILKRFKIAPLGKNGTSLKRPISRKAPLFLQMCSGEEIANPFICGPIRRVLTSADGVHTPGRKGAHFYGAVSLLIIYKILLCFTFVFCCSTSPLDVNILRLKNCFKVIFTKLFDVEMVAYAD